MSHDHQPYFHYEPLDASTDCFRLCKILPGLGDSPVICELTNEAISTQSGHYEALSYTWGTDRQQQWIKLNDKPYHVQSNLLLALRAIRKHDESLLVWIDAICINQSVAAEQVHQVSVMGDIYRNARRVLAWIGPAADDSDAIFDYLENLSAADDEAAKEAREAAAKRALCHLNNRPYWRRAWIKQELILARDITVYCGSKKSHNKDSFFWISSLHLIDGVTGYEDYIFTLCMHRYAQHKGKSETLLELMTRYTNTECLHIRDRVFALYSMAADCQERGSSIIDYSISIPALFFTLLAHFKPSDVLAFAAVLQETLNVRTVQLQEYWDNVSTEDNVPTASGVEALALAYIRQMKIYGKSLSSGGCITSTPDFIVRSYIANFAPEALGKSDKHYWINPSSRFESSRFILCMKHTLLGLRFRRVYESNRPRDFEHEIKVFQLPFTISEAWKYMILPSILLQMKTRHFYKAEHISPLKKQIIENHGVDAMYPSIDIICCTLAEMSRREAEFVLCLVDCKYVVCTLYGHTLLRPLKLEEGKWVNDSDL
jgi:hypothetical protein